MAARLRHKKKVEAAHADEMAKLTVESPLQAALEVYVARQASAHQRRPEREPSRCMLVVRSVEKTCS